MFGSPDTMFHRFFYRISTICLTAFFLLFGLLLLLLLKNLLVKAPPFPSPPLRGRGYRSACAEVRQVVYCRIDENLARHASRCFNSFLNVISYWCYLLGDT